MMLRFLPDTWQEAILRPLAMAAPDAGIYIEIMAPDGRFLLLLFAVASLLVAYITRKRFKIATPKALFTLLIFTGASFGSWLLTSGNGRYFIAILLIVGPLLIGVIRALPISHGARLFIALTTIGLQAFFLQQSSPWQTWGLLRWSNGPYFHVQVPEEFRSSPATFVTASDISYSLIAPQFHVDSNWVNIAHSPGRNRIQSFLAKSRRPIYLLIPTINTQATLDGKPSLALITVISDRLQPYGLFFLSIPSCQILPSLGVRKMNEDTLSTSVNPVVNIDNKVGFWVCPLQYKATQNYDDSRSSGRLARYDNIFRKIEDSCPRFFPPGSSRSSRVEGGLMRVYPDSEMKLYVLDDGSVLYTYYRALNPVRIGSRSEVLAGIRYPDCTNIPGRTGLPWQRDR